MKTKTLLTTLIGSTLLIGSLTSCEPIERYGYYNGYGGGSDYRMDQDQSIAFSGQWTGDFGMYYNYTWHGYSYTYNSYDTDIIFYPQFNGATYGWGKEVDFYTTGPYTYIYHRFSWKITNGIVYLYYDAEPALDTWIRDYHMTNDYFTGYFGNSNSSFRLIKIADLYDWTPYVDTYSYGERRDWSYVKGEKNMDEETAEQSDTTLTKSTLPDGTITCGNRFNK